MHEIGHTFFYDRRQSEPERVGTPTAEEEYFCDVFAAGLLLPEPLPEGTVSELSERYLTPLPVVRWTIEGFSRAYWRRFVSTCSGPDW